MHNYSPCLQLSRRTPPVCGTDSIGMDVAVPVGGGSASSGAWQSGSQQQFASHWPSVRSQVQAPSAAGDASGTSAGRARRDMVWYDI